MSAGDLKILGWFGDGGEQYKVVEAPSVEYVPTVTSGIKRLKKTLDISYVVPTYLKQSVIQGLQVDNASVSVESPTDKSGTMGTVSYGGGWTLVRLSTPAHDKANSRLNIHYEKDITMEFEIGLPTGITMTGENGIGYIKYLGNTLFSFDSGNTEGSNEWGHVPHEAFDNVTYVQTSYTTQSTKEYDGVEYENNGFVSYARPKTEQAMCCSLMFNGVKIKKVDSTTENYQTLGFGATGTSSTRYFSSGIWAADGTPLKATYNYQSSRSYEYIDLDSVYKGLKWNRTGNIITLKFWEITLFEWDVTGLT